MTTPTGSLLPGALIHDRYKIVRQIGRGGMGAVYEAIDIRLSNTVALKQTLVRSAELDEAFAREARLLSALRHPALPVVSDFFADGDGRFLVMQFIPGADLATLLEQQSAPFGLGEVVPWAEQLLDALEYLHQQQPPIIHRDIKPQNLKLTPRGELILLDFGLAKGGGGTSSHAPTSVSLFGYTPQFAPLEQIRASGTGPRSDIYSFAATIYALLTKRAPINALERAETVLQGQPDPLPSAASLNPQVPQALSDLLDRCMALNLTERPATAADVRAAWRTALTAPATTTLLAERTVQRAASPAAPPLRPPATPEYTPRALSRGGGCMLFGLASFILVLLTIIGGAIFMISRDLPNPLEQAQTFLTEQALAPTSAPPVIDIPPIPTFEIPDLPDMQATIDALTEEFDLPPGLQQTVEAAIDTVDPPSNGLPSLLTPVRSFGSAGRTDGTLDDPRAVVVGPDGAIYVADYNTGRVQRFSAEGSFERSWLAPDPNPLIFALAVDRQHRLYIGQASRISIYDGVSGAEVGGFRTPGGDSIDDLVVQGDGTLVGLTTAGDIVRFDAEGRELGRLVDPVRELADGAGMPDALAVDGLGTLYVLAESGSYVYIFSADGRFRDRFSVPDSTPFTGIDVDPQGRIYVGGFWKNIQIFDQEGQLLETVPVDGSVRDLTITLENQIYAVTNSPAVLVFALTP
jgi:serine/threonine protein kinase/sugar lactone lactonase YvrE